MYLKYYCCTLDVSNITEVEYRPTHNLVHYRRITVASGVNRLLATYFCMIPLTIAPPIILVRDLCPILCGVSQGTIILVAVAKCANPC